MNRERLSKLAGITEIEINPGDSIVNSLDDIEKYYNKILSSLDPYDYNRKIDDWVMEIKDAVEKIRTRLNDLND